MSRKLRVFGGMNTHPRLGGQARCVIAAPSQREAAEGAGISLHYFRGYWTETGNAREIAVALAHPGVPCYGNQGASIGTEYEAIPLEHPRVVRPRRRPRRAAPAPANMISPAQQLRHVAHTLLAYTAVTRPPNGRNRCATYAANTDAIAQTGRQLAELVLAYLEGTLAPVPAATDEQPF